MCNYYCTKIHAPTLQNSRRIYWVNLPVRKLLRSDIQRIKSIGAVCAVFKQVLFRLVQLLTAFVRAETVAPTHNPGSLNGKNKVIVVLTVEERHQPLLACIDHHNCYICVNGTLFWDEYITDLLNSYTEFHERELYTPDDEKKCLESLKKWKIRIKEDYDIIELIKRLVWTLEKYFKIPAGRDARLVLAVGYAANPDAPINKVRKTLEEVCSFNEW